MQHIKRVNYKFEFGTFPKKAKSYIPHPSVHGWVDENGRLESRWFWREQLIPEEFAYMVTYKDKEANPLDGLERKRLSQYILFIEISAFSLSRLTG